MRDVIPSLFTGRAHPSPLRWRAALVGFSLMFNVIHVGDAAAQNTPVCGNQQTTRTLYVDGTMANASWGIVHVTPSHPWTVHGFQGSGGNPGSWWKGIPHHGTSDVQNCSVPHPDSTVGLWYRDASVNPATESVDSVTITYDTNYNYGSQGIGNLQWTGWGAYQNGQWYTLGGGGKIIGPAWEVRQFTATAAQMTAAGMNLTSSGAPIHFGFLNYAACVAPNSVTGVDNVTVQVASTPRCPSGGTGFQQLSCTNGATAHLTFNEGNFIPGCTSQPHPNCPGVVPGTAITNQYRDSGVLFSTSNGGQLFVSNKTVVPAVGESGPSGGNLLAVASLNDAAGTPATISASFIDPATGNPATVPGSSISFHMGDGNSTPQPRVIIRTFDRNGNQIEERLHTQEYATIAFASGQVARVDFIDNGGDGHTIDDFRFGPLSCASQQCGDGIDNDGDGAADFPNDFSCSSATDTDETNPKSQCQDGVDNDGDGKADLQDPGCTSQQDNSEVDSGECVVVRAWTHGNRSRAISGGAEHGADYAQWNGTGVTGRGTYAAKPLSFPSNVTWIDYDMSANTVNGTVTDATNGAINRPLSSVKLFILSDTNTSVAGTAPNRTPAVGELNLIRQAHEQGMNMVFIADNGPTGSSDNAAQGTLDILNNIQTALHYSPVTTGDTAGVRTANATLFPIFRDATFDFSFGGNKETPGWIDQVNSPAQCAISNAGYCRVAYAPRQSAKGFIAVSGNAWVASATIIRNAIESACGQQSVSQCSDGIDNDGDGAVDFPNDYSCTSATDTDEANPKASCQDGVDNDGDGNTDFPADPGCSNKQDTDESNQQQNPQCSDGIDNDNDGATDFPNDISCSSATDTDETNPRAQCQDGIDNDNDGKSDAQDPGCHANNDINQPYNPNDNTESGDSSSCNASSITLTTTDTPDPASPNQDLTYQITVSNVSAQAQTFSLASSLDPNVVFLSASDGGTIQGQASVAWQNLSIGSSASKTLTLTTRVSGSAQHGSTITFTSSACGRNDIEHTYVTNSGKGSAQCSDGLDNDYDGKTDHPSDPGCSSPTDNDETDLAPQGADLSITKAAAPQINRGSVLVYNLTLTNSGPASATNVTVTDPIPSGLSFLSAQSDAACSQNGPNVFCTNLSLNANQTRQIALAFTVSQSIACNAAITNSASVSSSAQSDPNAGNNQSQQVTTTVTCPTPQTTRASITKSANRDEAQPGDVIIYTVTVTNLTATPATNITVTDVVTPSSVTVTDPAGGTISGNAITWTIPTLGANATHTIVFKLKAGQEMQHGSSVDNTVTATSSSLEYPVSASEEVRILRSLPQTGMMSGYVGRMGNNAQIAHSNVAQVSSSSDASPLAVLWITVVSLGLLGGTVTGKKLFLS